MGRTRIEWATDSWNPVTGCTKVSAGCDNCYAHALANGRLRETYRRGALPVVDNRENREDPFAIRLWPARLRDPERWRDRRIIFVNSMSDLFHVDVPNDYVRRIFTVMLTVTRHIYQVLTKRPARAAKFFEQNIDLFPNGIVPPHIWMGTSVESQDVDYRIRQLAGVPAAVRFLSCEPLLGPLRLDLREIHWVIVGGESGVGFRPLDLSWARDIRDQCITARVPFFFKQIGGRTPKAGGRRLDRKLWDQMPNVSIRQ